MTTNHHRPFCSTVRGTASLLVMSVLTLAAPQAQSPASRNVTTPKQQFGHDIGDDYVLVNYTRYVEYLRKLDRESDRMIVVDIGPTEEGRRELTAIITSPQNHRNLARYKAINERIARAEGLDETGARQLAQEGKAVVWIDGGLHATEVLGAQQLIETMYRLNSRTDPETLRILNDTIVLCTLVNPDGMELVSNWYMREPDPKKRSMANLPRLYQKYIGHDNNRDFYMANMSESANANRMMYREWYPVIMFNHHQTGPAGAVLFAPPFRDPFNYNFDPLIPLGIDTVGAAIHTRLAAEGKPGAVMRSAAPYSTWFNGGLRTTAYFHNQIGILTETIGSPTPIEIPLVLDMQLPRGDVPNPVAPQTWHFKQSVEYSVTTNYAVLDIASKRKEDFLLNMFRMARNAIENGSRDHWTIHPSRIKAARAEMQKAASIAGRGVGAPVSIFNRVLHEPGMRDPRGFIIPSDQPDFLTATKFVNILIKGGVDVHRATAPFVVAGKTYPTGSYVVKSAQAFRAHLLDMFEPQHHPDDIPYPGAVPRAPYDVTGYNIAYSMGITFDRILDGFDGPFEKIPDVVKPPAGSVPPAGKGGGYLLSHEINDSFHVMNRLLNRNEAVFWYREAVRANGKQYRAGTMFIPWSASAVEILRKVAEEKGVSVDAVESRPAGDTIPLAPVRIGLWDRYGGSMPSGWTRWILEQYEFPFDLVYASTLDAGNLRSKFDVLIFVDAAIPLRDLKEGETGYQRPTDPESIPAEYRDRLGQLTVAKTVPALAEFLEAGGTVLTIGSSTVLSTHLRLPIRNALTEIVNGAERPLSSEKFYVPGSILEARVDNAHALAFGMPERAHVFFDRSPAFRLPPDAWSRGIRPVVWFDSAASLKSGWAWGQPYLDQAVAIVDAPVGRGRLVLFGPEVVWRAQPHGTFKLLFNGIFLGAGQQNARPTSEVGQR
jgi:hypothetical protein